MALPALGLTKFTSIRPADRYSSDLFARIILDVGLNPFSEGVLENADIRSDDFRLQSDSFSTFLYKEICYLRGYENR